MKRDEALVLLTEHLKNKNLVKHCLSVEACMRALAVRVGHDPDPWGLAGILHDLDYEVTEKSPEFHTTETVKILRAVSYTHLTLPTLLTCRSRWSPYH